MSRIRRHTISFKCALEGLLYVLRTQPNFQVHLTFAILAVLAGFYFGISVTEWLIITFTICLVLIAETTNTAVEAVIDLLTQEYHLKAKIAKDVSAGTVLLTATCSVIIGLLIFLPHLI